MPEWIPITGHVDPYNQPNRQGMDPALDQALGTVRWGDESTVIFSRYLGIEIMDWFPAPYKSKHKQVWSEQRKEGDDTITIWHTPCGDLREVRHQCREARASYLVEHLIKDAKDLPAIASIFEDEEFEINPERMEVLRNRRELIGDDGVIIFSMPGTPLGMLIRVYAGVATTAYLYADAPEALHDLFAVMGENHLRRFRLVAACDAEALVGVDDTSTTTLSPAMFEAFCIDYTNRMAEVCHQAGKFYFHHSCGLIRDLLDLYRQTKMDAVHALQVPPLGNVTIREAKRRLGSQIAIIASLNQLFGPVDDWDQVKESVRQMFEGAATGDNFVLGLAPDPTKNMEQTQRLLDECRKYQQSVRV